jgi:hypothetical protein
MTDECNNGIDRMLFGHSRLRTASCARSLAHHLGHVWPQAHAHSHTTSVTPACANERRSNAKKTWADQSPMDCDGMLVKQAAANKRTNPTAKVFVYRNIVKALVHTPPSPPPPTHTHTHTRTHAHTHTRTHAYAHTHVFPPQHIVPPTHHALRSTAAFFSVLALVCSKYFSCLRTHTLTHSPAPSRTDAPSRSHTSVGHDR